MGQTLLLVQDEAATVACRERCQEYLARKGYRDVFTPVTLLHWMGAWPKDEAQSAALIAYGGGRAAHARADGNRCRAPAWPSAPRPGGAG